MLEGEIKSKNPPTTTPLTDQGKTSSPICLSTQPTKKIKLSTKEEKCEAIIKDIQSTFAFHFPRTINSNKASLLLQLLQDGKLFGPEGSDALKDEHVMFGSERFKAWKF